MSVSGPHYTIKLERTVPKVLRRLPTDLRIRLARAIDDLAATDTPRVTEDLTPEIAIVGDLTEHESELTDRLLDVEPGGSCILYFDSPGGSPYCAMSLMTLIRLLPEALMKRLNLAA